MNFKDRIRARNNDVKVFNEIITKEVEKVKQWDNEINIGVFKEVFVLNWHISNDKEIKEEKINFDYNLILDTYCKNQDFRIGEPNIIYQGKILSLISIPFKFTASFYIAINMGYTTLKETKENNVIKPMWKLDEMKIKPIQTQVIKDKLRNKKEYFYLIAYKPAILDKEFVLMDFLNYLKKDESSPKNIFDSKILDFTKILNVEEEINEKV